MIDDHCHLFDLEGGPFDAGAVTLDVRPGPEGDARRRAAAGSRLFVETVTTRLARFLGCAPDDVAAARAEASRRPGYVRRLFDDAGLDALVVDIGGEPRDDAALAPYRAALDRPLWWLARVDPLVDRLVEAGASAAEVVETVERFCADAAAAGCAGFKTILAYRTGLAVDPTVTLADAERSLRDADGPVRRRGKACRDLVVRRVLAVAAELGKPVQVHTGFGDSELRLAESNPLLLEELLRCPEGEAATVVLIHGSFPWLEEQAYLAGTKPNLYAELSLFNLFAPATVADRMLRTLELAPVDRVLVGTDGHGEPETLWYAAHVLHDAWRRAAAALAEAGARPQWLDRARRLVFDDNARALYAG